MAFENAALYQEVWIAYKSEGLRSKCLLLLQLANECKEPSFLNLKNSLAKTKRIEKRMYIKKSGTHIMWKETLVDPHITFIC